MKRWIALLLAMVMALSLLSGCGKKTTKKKSSGSKKSSSSQQDETESSTGDTGATAGKVEAPDQPKGEAAAMTSTGHELDTATVNFYMVNYVENMYRQYQSYYGDMTAAFFSYNGLDIAKPLTEQYYQEPQTWAGYFLDVALEQAACDLVLWDAAKAAGHQLTAEEQSEIANQIQAVKDSAAMLAYDSADAYLAVFYGAEATLEAYKTYLEVTTLAESYYNAYEAAIAFTEDELDQYGQNHLPEYSDSQYLANVRHLLVEFEGGISDPMGGTYYTDEEKATAKAEAEMLLYAWRSGAATEESFISMVQEFTDDPGSKETGGFYGDIHSGSPYVEAFLNWSINPDRKVGDIAIVETEYGYHIMYFVGYGDKTHRDFVAEEQLRAATMQEWYNGLTGDVTFELVKADGLKLDLVLANFG